MLRDSIKLEMNFRLATAFAFAAAGMGMPLAGAASDRSDPNLCIQMSKPELGKPCGKDGDKYTMKLTNSCAEPIALRYCMLRQTGSWSCGLRPKLAPREEINAQTCDGTGQGWAAARWPGDKGRMPDPNDGAITGTGEGNKQVCDSLLAMPGSMGPCTCQPLGSKGAKVRCVVVNNHKSEKTLMQSARDLLRDKAAEASAREKEKCQISPEAPGCKRSNGSTGGTGLRN